MNNEEISYIEGILNQIEDLKHKKASLVTLVEETLEQVDVAIVLLKEGKPTMYRLDRIQDMLADYLKTHEGIG